VRGPSHAAKKTVFQATLKGETGMARLILTGKAITLPQGVSSIRSHEFLLGLFCRALSQLSEFQAILLVQAYRDGKAVRCSMVQSSRGNKRTAFQWLVTE
jgi:hypothetical protein